MRTRMMVGAFLTYNGKVLLMHRGMHKELAPGMWSCVGGHMEPEEINSPADACYREVLEETGIPMEVISNLKLRYITIRNTGDEIRTGYYFMGEITHKPELLECDEGTLHWINPSDMVNLPMSFSIKEIIEHWLTNPDTESVLTCVINRDNNSAIWAEL